MDMLGAVHGRFQMLHLGHMEYILEGKKRCQHLIVGITNPDSIYTRYSESNPHRSAIEANPLTYYERLEMIRGALLEAGVPRKEFTIVPFPIAAYEHLLSYIPIEADVYKRQRLCFILRLMPALRLANILCIMAKTF